MTLLPGLIRPERPARRPLPDLVRAFALRASGDLTGRWTTGIAVRTDDLRPGDVFAALPGASAHGASYADRAAVAGAIAVLTDEAGARLASGSGLPVLVADDPRAALGEVAAWIHQTGEGMPLLLGVTGTNGKTTTVHLIESLLERLGIPAGVSSTAERGAAGERVTSRLTTPEADELHALLARMAERGVRAAALEVSAQALVRSRVDGLVFDVAGFTNLTHDHLDDFGTMEAYLDAKARLFAEGTSRSAVVSLDSAAGGSLARRAAIPVTTVTTLRGVAADWRVSDVVVDRDRTRFVTTAPGGERLAGSVDLLGRHQAANAALAVAMVAATGVAVDRLAEALADGLHFRVGGRMEHLPGSADPEIRLDVAHTPDALRVSLGAMRAVTPGRLVAVLGADGDRDATKRGPMGRVAAELADAVVIHDHHSRHEDPARIRAMLLEGARGAGSAAVHEVPDPSEAIRFAVRAAGEGGAVLWAGTGRTEYRDVAGTKRPYSFWDEAAAVAAEHRGAAADGLRR